MSTLAQNLIALSAQIRMKAEESGDPALGRLAARAYELSEAPEAAGRLITARELAVLLNRTEKAVRTLASEGDIPYHKIGGSVKFNLCEVLEATRRN